jgi:phosphatidylserine decarboxylase
MYLLFVLPKKLLSRFVGFLMGLKLPKLLRKPIIGGFASVYNINLMEAERALETYPSIGDFFVRRLKEGARPISECEIVHPADALISQASSIASGALIQAKGKTYDIVKFLGSEDYAKKLTRPKFMTYYLCPTDYHRVHSPITAKVKSIQHIPGNLWPVNNWSVERIDELFAINERVVVELEAAVGTMYCVLVGATNVGKMTLSFDPEIISNRSNVKKPIYKEYENVILNKGDELGCFHMGSTVVLVMDEAFAVDVDKYKGQNSKVGSALV